MSDRAWNNDFVQFARLLCEIAATQDVDFGALSESMDLEKEHIDELFERAYLAWEGVKAHGLPMCKQVGPAFIEVEEDDVPVYLGTKHDYDVSVKATEHELLVLVHKCRHDEPIVVVDKFVRELETGA